MDATEGTVLYLSLYSQLVALFLKSLRKEHEPSTVTDISCEGASHIILFLFLGKQVEEVRAQTCLELKRL